MVGTCHMVGEAWGGGFSSKRLRTSGLADSLSFTIELKSER